MYGIGLGLLIPIFGAIGPIQNALNVELREALDITRSKTKVRCDYCSLSTRLYHHLLLTFFMSFVLLFCCFVVLFCFVFVFFVFLNKHTCAGH